MEEGKMDLKRGEIKDNNNNNQKYYLVIQFQNMLNLHKNM